jgi:putative toxin-antitoxin system antitoxin component (TIGR02293 family)
MHSTLIEEILGAASDDERPKGPGRLDELHQLIHKGVPAKTIGRIEKVFGLTASQSARLMAISETSRKRFKQTPTRRLDQGTSDRIVRLVSTAAQAAEIFGSEEKAIAWFKSPSLALNGKQPLELMTSDPGARIVRDELARIRYGHWA